MSFSGDKPIVESILYDVSGSAVAVTHSASLDMTTQAGVAIAGFYSSSTGFTARVLQVDDEGRLMVDAQIVPAGIQTVTGSVTVNNFPAVQAVTGSVSVSGPVTINQPVAVTDNGGSLTVDGTVTVTDGGGSITVDGAVSVDDGGGSITVDGTVTALVTGTVNLDRGNDAVTPLFVTGSFAIGNQVTITGSVGITGPVTINQPVTVTGSVIANVTGTVNLDRGNSTVNPLFMTGAVGITGPVTVTGVVGIAGAVVSLVTGTVNLDRGNDATLPLYMTGTVGISGPVTVNGTVTAAVTGTVNLDRGNSTANPLFTTGSVGITGPVTADFAIHTTASGTFIAASNSVSQVVLAANPNRRGLVFHNESNKAVYLNFGATASPTNFTVKVFSDDNWVMPDFLYSGIISAIWLAGGTANSGLYVTQITA
jgi:hypothetical protein